MGRSALMAVSLVTAFVTAVSAINNSAISTTFKVSATNPFLAVEYCVTHSAARAVCAKGVRWDVCGANQSLLTAGRQATNAAQGNSLGKIGVFYLAAPTAGTAILRGNTNTTVAGTQAMGVTIWSGATGVRAFAGNAGDGTGTNTVTAASTTGDVVLDALCVRSTAAQAFNQAVGPDQTERWERNVADGNANSGLGTSQKFAGSTQAGAVCALMSWTTATAAWGMVAISLAPSAAGAGGGGVQTAKGTLAVLGAGR